MDALEIMFGKRSIADKIEKSKTNTLQNNESADHDQKSKVNSMIQIKDASTVKEDLKRRFIAFDTETTGFSCYKDRIIEIGAVLFENGKPVKSFGTLINAGKPVPLSASRVNNITNDMLIDAPSEKVVYTKFVEFLEDAINGDTILCAHNASFDMRFLSATFERLSIGSSIRFVDTLSLCKKCVSSVDNYKQPTMANYFGIEQKDAHRAESDALVCGKIMVELLKMM